MKRIVYLIIMGFFIIEVPKPASAQDSDSLKQDTVYTSIITNDSANITPLMQVYKGTVPIGNIQQLLIQQGKRWAPCRDSIPAYGIFPATNYWFRIIIKNDLTSQFSRLLYFKYFDFVELYKKQPNDVRIQIAGEKAPLKKWSYAYDNHVLQLNLKDGETGIFYLRCAMVDKVISHPNFFSLRTYANAESFQLSEIKNYFTDILFLFFYLGFLSFCFLYFFFQYFFKKNYSELLTYTLYILCTLLYSARDIDKYYFTKIVIPVFDGFYTWPEPALSYLSYIFYALFLSKLFNLKVVNKKAYWLIHASVAFQFLLLIADIVLKVRSQQYLSYLIFDYARNFFYLLSIFYLFLIFTAKSPVSKYFRYGSVALLTSVGVNLAIRKLRHLPGFFWHDSLLAEYGFWTNTVNYTRLGTLVEIVFFSLGLSRKIQIDYAQSAMLNLNNNYTGIIFHEIKNGLNKLIGLFKSNSGNSIPFIHQLSDILSDSLEINEAKISLKDELMIVERYFNFRLKSNQKIELKIVNHAVTSLDKVNVPPMLLQPFVENCLKHAFADAELGDNKIAIDVIEGKKYIQIELTDNGMGFKHSTINSKSKGTKLIEDRLHFFNGLFSTSICFESGNRKEAAGAIVTIYNLPKNKL